MAALTKKAAASLAVNCADGKDAFIAVMRNIFAADDLSRLQALLAYAPQGAVDKAELEVQLLLLADVLRVAAAAQSEIRAGGYDARRRRFE